jgi:hypothetical protein
MAVNLAPGQNMRLKVPIPSHQTSSTQLYNSATRVIYWKHAIWQSFDCGLLDRYDSHTWVERWDLGSGKSVPGHYATYCALNVLGCDYKHSSLILAPHCNHVVPWWSALCGCDTAGNTHQCGCQASHQVLCCGRVTCRAGQAVHHNITKAEHMELICHGNAVTCKICYLKHFYPF